ncbi:PAS domain S-box protein [Sansalvadorimonas verongulae]|uniref:PAS domain S-box protein n=1 Tax=Sansalvadorimonas verongulae TaxID=2172824 RepID=UPI0012BBD3FB|nr:PAS domain S-box protein [Sansalvadorimonas verongulae]MTI14891.1 PAS domain S-box protein [Sansalvadorimonas verongulae]
MWSSIRNKVVLFAIVPITLLYSVIFVIHILENLRVAKGGVEAFMEQQAGHFASLLNGQVRHIASLGDALSHSLGKHPEHISEYHDLLSSTLKDDRIVQGIFFGEPGKGRIFYYADTGFQEVPWPETVDSPLDANAWGWSRPFKSPMSDEKVVAFHSPKVAKLYFFVRIDRFIELLKHDNPRNLRFVIVDRDSHFIHSDMRSTRPDDSLRDTALRLRSDSLLKLVDGPVHSGTRGHETVFFRDWPTWYFSSPVPDAGWILLTHIRETTALGAARQPAINSAMMLLLVLLIVSACVLKVSGFITRPLVRLTRAVDNLGDGHWHLPFQHKADDETGRLARSISAMAHRLSERDEALKDLRATNISHMAERLRGRYFYYMLNDSGRVSYISASVSDILGYSSDELVEAMAPVFAGTSGHKALRQVIQGVLQGHPQNDAVQIELPHKDGGTRTIEVINVPVVEPGGRISGVEGMGHDVTELVGDTKKFRGLLEAAPDAIVITDTEEIITMVNARVEEMFGYRRQELVGQPLAMLSRKRAGYLLPRQKYETESLQQGFETICRRRNGTSFSSEVTSSPLKTASGTLVTIVIRDISERKATERDLRLARDKARAADHAKSQFLSNMSHELRTPLNGILGHVQLLLRTEKLEPRQRESLETVEDCGQHLLMLINDVLDLTKIETTGTQVQFQPVKLRPMLDKVCRILRPRADRKNLQLLLNVDEHLPPVILIDVTKLRQVLINLLGNAIKFTDHGQVQLRVVQDGERIVYVVSDTGIGIEADQQEKIFSPFHQVDFQDHPGGTGLGLAISQRLVSAQGGALKVASSLGAGSRFYFSLPLRRAVLDEGAQSSASSHDVCSFHLPPEETAKVLVVDDSRINREMLVRLLDDAGFETLEAVNGLDALNCIQASQPQLVLMDIRMPVMSGSDAVRQLRRNGNPVPVIAVTASVDPIQQKKIEGLGFNGYVGKPFRIDDLFQQIERTLNVHFIRKEIDVEIPDSQLSPLSNQALKPLLKTILEAVEMGDVDRIRMLTQQLQEADPEVWRLYEKWMIYAMPLLSTDWNITAGKSLYP